MTDEQIIQEAVRLVQDGVSVTFPVKGRSMIPFIFGGRESVILQKTGSLQRGQVVLAQVGTDRYVVHRIIKVEADRITLMGDGNTCGTESCTPANVLAVATHVVDENGRRRPLDSFIQLAKAHIWYMIRPLRRYILAGFRLLRPAKYKI